MTNSDLVARQKRIDNLDLKLALAQRLKPLLDPDVQRLIQEHDANLVSVLVEAPDDEKRREAQHAVRAWRHLRRMIQTAVNGEAHAVTTLRKLTHGE